MLWALLKRPLFPFLCLKAGVAVLLSLYYSYIIAALHNGSKYGRKVTK